MGENEVLCRSDCQKRQLVSVTSPLSVGVWNNRPPQQAHLYARCLLFHFENLSAVIHTKWQCDRCGRIFPCDNDVGSEDQRDSDAGVGRAGFLCSLRSFSCCCCCYFFFQINPTPSVAITLAAITRKTSPPSDQHVRKGLALNMTQSPCAIIAERPIFLLSEIAGRQRGAYHIFHVFFRGDKQA